MGPPRSFVFPADFAADVDALSRARIRIAALEERQQRGELAQWNWDDAAEQPLPSGATDAPVDFANASPLEAGSAALYPTPRFSRLSSFPLATPGGPAVSTPSFRYPVSEMDLALLKRSMWDARKLRAQAARQGTGGLEPSASDVAAESARRVVAFERERAQLFSLQVQAAVEQGVRRALTPILGDFDADGEQSSPASPPALLSALLTSSQLQLLKLSYALLRVGGPRGPTTRYGRPRRAMPTFLRAPTAPLAAPLSSHDDGSDASAAASSLPQHRVPPCMTKHHLWREVDEATMAQDEHTFDDDDADEFDA
jgi:hypothetical protein